MKVVAAEHIVPCDIDGTLVIHVSDNHDIVIKCPYANEDCYLAINRNMVRLFKEEIARGSHMLVWSRGGNRWAEAVILALGLDHENITVMSKPFVYFDDLEVTEWLSQRVFLPHTTYFKR